MHLADLNEVMAIEEKVYSHPWSRGNFIDAVNSDYDSWTVRSVAGELLAYFVQMVVVDECHLLTIAVKPSVQRQGLGHYLLSFIVERAQRIQMKSLVLEVRMSNQQALTVYESFGFIQLGRRKNYYPLNQHQREDALILAYEIPE